MPVAGSQRRPADVWVPRGQSGKGEAFDFAVSSGLQSELVHPVVDVPGLVFQRYEAMKRSFKDTAQMCESEGFVFTPMVLEAHSGGLSPTFRSAVDWIAKRQATCQHEDPEFVSLKIAQRISCTLHRENARAILRTAGAPSASPFPPSGWENGGI